ncbi:MAG: O-antigen ligase family protein [Fusobacteriaceae bacterium]
MIEKVYKKLEILAIVTILVSLLSLLTHSYFRSLSFLWLLVGVLFIKRDGYKKTGLELPILLYLVSLFISLIAPLDFKHSYKEIYRHLYGFLAPFTISQFVIEDKKKKKFLDIVIKSVTSYFFIKTILMVLKIVPSKFGERYIPLLINPVEFSYIAGAIAIYSWVVFLKEENRYKKILNTSFLFAILYVILQTKTRGAWLGIAGALSIVYIFKNMDIVKNITKVIFSFLNIIVFTYVFRNSTLLQKYYNRIISIGNTHNDYSNTARLIAWKIGIDRFKERFLTGWGYKVKNPYSTGPGGANQILDHPHNEYVAFLVGGGIIGLFGYLYLMVSIILKSFKNRENTYWLIILGLTVFTLIYGVVEALFQVSNSLFLFLLILGIGGIGEGEK